MRLLRILARISAVTVIGMGTCAGANAASEPTHVVTPSAAQSAAEQVVSRRIGAYNMHDIEAFLATYAQGVRIYVYPDRFLGQGRERMRRIFGPQFARGDGVVRIINQHTLDSRVVSIEDVTIGNMLERNIAIYTIEDGLIAEVRLIEPGE
jgi:hypothetical protein